MTGPSVDVYGRDIKGDPFPPFYTCIKAKYHGHSCHDFPGTVCHEIMKSGSSQIVTQGNNLLKFLGLNPTS